MDSAIAKRGATLQYRAIAIEHNQSQFRISIDRLKRTPQNQQRSNYPIDLVLSTQIQS
ncbi:hypothetical protein [Chamaesiphon sp.]|uniref:hypothetical protein n=1 Tax=Chamaesiphon sp. TaxID=2814140 RepID=UPI003592F3A6